MELEAKELLKQATEDVLCFRAGLRVVRAVVGVRMRMTEMLAAPKEKDGRKARRAKVNGKIVAGRIGRDGTVRDQPVHGVRPADHAVLEMKIGLHEDGSIMEKVLTSSDNGDKNIGTVPQVDPQERREASLIRDEMILEWWRSCLHCLIGAYGTSGCFPYTYTDWSDCEPLLSYDGGHHSWA